MPLCPRGSEKRSRIRIQWKILTLLLLFTGVILLGLWLSMVVFLDDIYKDIKVKEIERSAVAVSQSLDNERYQVEKICQRIAEKQQFCMVVYNIDRESVICRAEELPDSSLSAVLYQTNLYGIRSFNKRNAERLCRYAETNGGRVLCSVTDDEEPQKGDGGMSEEILTLRKGLLNESNAGFTGIVYTFLTANKAGERVAVFIGGVISPVRATVDTIRTLLLILSVGLIILAVLLSVLISTIISRPIRKLTRSAEILATGNYGVSFDGGGYKEITVLSDTLNYAAGELSKVDVLRKELIANVSHDLRTPLTMIQGYAEVMRDIPGENSAENLQIIIDETDRLKDLVGDLLDLSRLQAGAMEPKKTVFSLNEAVESAMSRYNKLRDREGFRISFTCDRPALVEADYGMILQVVYNLVNNAVNYAGAEKAVIIRQTAADGNLRLSVTDTGEGIPKEKLSMIFDRYYREEGNHKRAAVGSGLGLSIVKTIIDAHGGRYGVISAVGGGSTFWFELPEKQAT